MEQVLITGKELQEKLRISRFTILAWRSNGILREGIEFVRLNSRLYRYDLTACLDRLKNRNNESTSKKRGRKKIAA